MVDPQFRKFSYEQVKIAMDFVKNQVLNVNPANFSSCPNAIDKSTGQCKNMQEVPPFSACKIYSASSHDGVIAENVVAKKVREHEVVHTHELRKCVLGIFPCYVDMSVA